MDPPDHDLLERANDADVVRHAVEAHRDAAPRGIEEAENAAGHHVEAWSRFAGPDGCVAAADSCFWAGQLA